MKTLIISVILFISLCTQLSAANEVNHFYLQSKQSQFDKRFDYTTEVFRLALEKTRAEYGDYRLSLLDKSANAKRIESLVKFNTVKNLFFKSSVSERKVIDFAFAEFPVDLGIVGYRVAFVSANAKDQLLTVNSLEQLKEFSIVQGAGWLDSAILKRNEFQVIEGTSYQGLFSMISRNRADLFFRGANEILAEWNTHQHLTNFYRDQSIVLYYPLPRFFFTNIENADNAKRLEKGLKTAYYDGSLIKLWRNYYKDSIEFVNLKDRKMFTINNPFLTNIRKTLYQKYIFNPLDNIFK